MAIIVIQIPVVFALTLGDNTHLDQWREAYPIEEVKISGLAGVTSDRWRFEVFATTDHGNPQTGRVLATLNHDGESDIIEDTTVNSNVNEGESIGLRVTKRAGPDPDDDGGDEGQALCEIRYDDGL